MIKLSIIIPLYNSAKYIRKCLDSLLEQDIPHSDYEIVVVNDGSPDNSFDIVLSYTEQYKNIKLVSQENQGTSGARNTGIDIAQGKYMAFVDPDDYVQPNVYKELLRKMDGEDLDMLRFSFTIVDANYQQMSMPKGAKRTADYSDEIVEGKRFLSEKLGYACFVWTYIYKTSLIKNNQLYYQPGFYIDDTEWLPRVLICAKRVTSVITPVLFYVQHQGSLMNTNMAASTNKKIEGCFTAIDMLTKALNDNNDRAVLNWYKGMRSVIVMGLLEIISTDEKDYQKMYLTRLSDFKVFPLSFYNHSNHLKIKILLANIKPELYCKIASLTRK